MNNEDVERYQAPDTNIDREGSEAYKRGLEEEEELKKDQTLKFSAHNSEKTYGDPDTKNV